MPAAEPPGGAPPPPAAHVDVDAFPLIAMPPPMPPAGPVLPPANVQAAANNNPAAMNAEEATMLPFKDQLAHHRALRIADARAGTLHVRAAGVTFDGRQGNLEDAREREENGRKQALLAVREPDNPHDGNAVRLEVRRACRGRGAERETKLSVRTLYLPLWHRPDQTRPALVGSCKLCSYNPKGAIFNLPCDTLKIIN